MKNKGFTLIELLAVIVILSIVLLIVVMGTTKLTENAEKSAAERGADNYFKTIETKAAVEKMKHNPLEGEYTVLENGNLCPVNTTCTDETDVDIKMSGNKPNSGKVIIENGQVINGTIITIDEYTIEYGKKTSTDSPLYICEKTGEASKTVGAEYICHLDTDRTFYVLENLESSKNISLIMDSNFTDDVIRGTLQWCINGGTATATCKNITSKEEGTPLKHIQDTFGDNVIASVPTVSQIATASGKKFNNSTIKGLESWLYKNLYNTTPSGYWTSSPVINRSSSVWLVTFAGSISYNPANNSGYSGIRPVITISKNKLD